MLVLLLLADSHLELKMHHISINEKLKQMKPKNKVENDRSKKDLEEKGSTISDELARWIFGLFFVSYRNLTSEGDAYLASVHLGRAHFRVLMVLYSKDGLTMGEIREILGISNQAITRVLKKLLKEKYVKQEFSTQDRRKRFLFLMNKGKNVVDEVTSAQKICLERALAEVGQEKMSGLCDSMASMLSESDKYLFEILWKDYQPKW